MEHGAITYLRQQYDALQKKILSLSDRITAQSELLSKRAEHAQQKESSHQEAEGTHGQGGEVGVSGVREVQSQHGPAGGSPPPA